MKSTTDNPMDPLGTLGAPIREAKPAPAPAPVAPGIVRNADGTLSTQIPDPQPLWAAPIYTPRIRSERDEQTCDFGGLLGCEG